VDAATGVSLAVGVVVDGAMSFDGEVADVVGEEAATGEFCGKLEGVAGVSMADVGLTTDCVTTSFGVVGSVIANK
jgi:hypothetical protein